MPGKRNPWWNREWDFKKGRYVVPGEVKPVVIKTDEVKPIETQPVTVVPVLHDIEKDPAKFVEFPKYDYVEEVLKYTQAELLTYLPEFLFATGFYSPERSRVTKDYLYFEGEIPVLLIAHLDTVHKQPVSKIYQHVTDKYLIAKEGIGGDDRCGVFAILYMVTHRKIPYILFTTDEETGTQGARAAAKEFKPSDKILFMVEIDRRGKEDSVYYDNDNKDFKKYIDAFGFKEATGSFSDISVLGDAWNISSVNLSSGYYSAHSVDEKISIWETIATAKKVMTMFDNLPSKRFEHVKKVYSYGGYGGYAWDDYDDYYGRYGGFDMYGNYGNVYGGHQTRKPPSADEEEFKGIPLKHLKKANDCVSRILDLQFVDKMFFGSNTSKTPGAVFIPKGEQGEVWVAELAKRSSRFSKAMPQETFDKIQPCVNFLTGMYSQHANFERAIGLFNHDEKKWTAYLERQREKPQKPSAREVAVVKGKQNDFDDLSSTEQRAIIYETIDCVEGLLSLPFVIGFSIDKGRNEIKIKAADYYLSSDISSMVKDSRFLTLLKEQAASEKDVEAFVNCLMLLDYRLKTLKGLDDEISKEIELSEKKLGKGTAYKTRQTELKVSEKPTQKSSWETLAKDLRMAMIKKANSGLEDIAALKFVVRIYDYAMKTVGITFIDLSGLERYVSIDDAEKDKHFNEVLEFAYKSANIRVLVMNFLIWLSTQIKEFPELKQYIVLPQKGNVKKEVESRSESPKLSKHVEEVLEKVAGLVRDDKDTATFYRLWKESYMDIDLAYERFKKAMTKSAGDFFDDAPSCKTETRPDIVDRYGQPEYSQRTRGDRKDTFEDEERSDESEEVGDEIMDMDEAIDILMGHFDKYNFYMDTDDVCASMFIDDEGVERPLKDLMKEVDATRPAKNRRILKAALETLLRYG